jgi:hypothetical protein
MFAVRAGLCPLDKGQMRASSGHHWLAGCFGDCGAGNAIIFFGGPPVEAVYDY